MDISAELYDRYARRRFRRGDWSLTVEGIKRALVELEEFADDPAKLMALIDNELDVI
jgi:Fe-S-cluster formation regulator IscX/YfhJ